MDIFKVVGFDVEEFFFYVFVEMDGGFVCDVFVEEVVFYVFYCFFKIFFCEGMVVDDVLEEVVEGVDFCVEEVRGF